MTLSELCGELKNWFDTSRYFGIFTITNGQIDLSELVTDGSLHDGQYFRIVGSALNDGVYQYPAYELNDESFNGAVWAMAVPKDVQTLLDDINTWLDTYAAQLDKPFQSESFAGYTYSIKGSLSGGTGAATEPWKAQFASRLNRWRKI